MRLVVTAQAQLELEDVWRYNAKRRGAAWARSYLRLLDDRIGRLTTEYPEGRPLEGFPNLLSMTFRKNPRGDGHIAVYEVDHDSETVNVLHVFHTKQDVRGRLSGER